jgi:chemotaxis protein methyltransferase CheR
MTTADFDYVRNFVREESAIVLEPGKEYLVESRLQTLARKENMESIEVLLSKLRSQSGHSYHRKVIDAMTTNETSFFRDIHPFDTLRKSLLPELMALRAKERKMSFWCGAAST